MTLTYDELNKIITGLPQDVQDAYWSVDVANEILDIGKKHGLAIDKIGNLGEETNLVMTGRSKPADFIKNLTDVLGIDKEKAKLIAEDVNQKVFQPIKASLRKVHGLPEEKNVTAAAIPPQAPPYKGGDKTESSPLQGEARRGIPPPPISTTSVPYVIPSKPAAPSTITPPAVPIPTITPPTLPKTSPAPVIPASTVVVGDTKLNFAPLPIAKKVVPTQEAPQKPASPPLPPIPQIFAKKITPIDALLDKIDAGESVIKPKQKIDSVSLQLNPPPGPPAGGGIKTMFRDAKTFLQNKTAPPSSPSAEPYVIPSKPAVVMPKQEKPSVVPPPNLPTETIPPANTTPLPLLAKEGTSEAPPLYKGRVGRGIETKDGETNLSRDTVKSEIENALGGKIKLDLPTGKAGPPIPGEASANSIKDPYREPVE